MKRIVRFVFLIIATAACASAWFVSVLKPTSAGAFMSLAAWLVSPYLVMGAALVFLQLKGKASLHWYIVAAIVSAGGILFLVDVIFWRPDAQGAIAVLMTPLLQGGALALLLPLGWWLSRIARS